MLRSGTLEDHSVKTRIICDGHYITRIDEDKDADSNAVLQRIKQADFSAYDIVVLSDYDKGTLDNAKKAMDTVTKTNNMAKSQLSASTNEMKEAQSRLVEAEKRWEVIEIDDLDGNDITKSKKRKVSISPPSRESNN